VFYFKILFKNWLFHRSILQPLWCPYFGVGDLTLPVFAVQLYLFQRSKRLLQMGAHSGVEPNHGEGRLRRPQNGSSLGACYPTLPSRLIPTSFWASTANWASSAS
jgi:hypothetical protein